MSLFKKKEEKPEVMVTRTEGKVTERIPAKWVEEEHYEKERERLALREAERRGRERAEQEITPRAAPASKAASGFNWGASRDALSGLIGSPSKGKLSQPKMFRTKTVYKKVGKHYKKVSRRVPIRSAALAPKQSNPFGFFGGSSNSGMDWGAYMGGNGKKGKKKSNGGFTGFRIGL